MPVSFTGNLNLFFSLFFKLIAPRFLTLNQRKHPVDAEPASTEWKLTLILRLGKKYFYHFVCIGRSEKVKFLNLLSE